MHRNNPKNDRSQPVILAPNASFDRWRAQRHGPTIPLSDVRVSAASDHDMLASG
jgi:hypothetical protein